MRITLVISGLSGGGAERVAVNLANAWSTRGYRSVLLTIARNKLPPAYPIDDGVEQRDVGWPRSARENELNATTAAAIMRGLHANESGVLIRDLSLLAMLRFAILATSPDLVVSFITQTNVRVLAALHETKLPVIVCEVTDTRRLYLRDWHGPRDMFYRHAAGVVAPDPLIAEWLGARGARAFSIHNPLVPPTPHNPLTAPTPVHNLLPPPVAPIPSNKPSRQRVITLSRLSTEKRPELLLRAFALVAKRWPSWDLEFYGTGPQQNFLEHLAEDLAPPGRIKFCGFTSDHYGVLHGADIFVSASWIEGFGNAIWEALACGVPVIAMDAGPPVRALVRHGIDGLIVAENSTPALADALEHLMSDESERKSYAARAPEVVERFSLASALKQWDDLLAELVTPMQARFA